MSEKLDLFEITVKQGLERLELPLAPGAWAEFEPKLIAAEQQSKKVAGSFLGKFAAAGIVLLGSVLFINYSVGESDINVTHNEIETHNTDSNIGNSAAADDLHIETPEVALDLQSSNEASRLAKENAQQLASEAATTAANTAATNEAAEERIARINDKLQAAADRTEITENSSSSDSSRPRSTTRYVGDHFNLGAPQFFTPDGNGKDDFFIPSALTAEDSFRMKVRDENGTIVFTSTSIDTPWTGLDNEQVALAEGRYNWEVILSADKKKEIFRGTVKLKR